MHTYILHATVHTKRLTDSSCHASVRTTNTLTIYHSGSNARRLPYRTNVADESIKQHVSGEPNQSLHLFAVHGRRALDRRRNSSRRKVYRHRSTADLSVLRERCAQSHVFRARRPHGRHHVVSEDRRQT